MASTILADAPSAWVFGLITTPFGWRWANCGRPLEADPLPIGTESPDTEMVAISAVEAAKWICALDERLSKTADETAYSARRDADENSRAIPGLRHVRDRHRHHAIISIGQDPAEVFASFLAQLSVGPDLADRKTTSESLRQRIRRMARLPSPRCTRSRCRAVDRGRTETRRLHAPPRRSGSNSVPPGHSKLRTRDPNSRGRKPNSLVQSAPP
jgi:hypothetical protein